MWYNITNIFYKTLKIFTKEGCYSVNDLESYKEIVGSLVSEYISQLNPIVDTQVVIFLSQSNKVESTSKRVLDLIQKSKLFGDNSDEDKILSELNKQINKEDFVQDKNYDEDLNINNNIKYFNYITLEENNEKLLFLFRFQGFQQEVIDIYMKQEENSFLKYMLNSLFQHLRSTRSFLVDEKFRIKTKKEQLTIYIREYINDLMKLICDANDMCNYNDLFDDLNRISTLNYEGESVSAKLLILNERNMKRYINFFIRLHKEIEYGEHRKIRKILEISDPDTYLIGDENYVYGIGRLKNFSEIKELDIEKRILTIEFLGRFQYKINSINIQRKFISQTNDGRENISWFWRERTNITIKDGKPLLQENRFSKETLEQELKETFKNYFEDNDYETKIIEEKISGISEIIDHATNQKHGTMVVISYPELAKKEIKRLKNQCIRVVKTQILKQKDKATNKKVIEKITSIDGALYIDIEGDCYAIGVILDGVVLTEKGDTSRGARYNSAIRYQNMNGIKKKCVIVIISEDGMVDIIPDSKEEKKDLNRRINEVKSLAGERDFKQALKQLEKVIELDNKNAEAFHLKAILLNYLDKESSSIEELIDLCSKAIQLNMNYLQSYITRSSFYRRIKEFNKAIQDCNKVIELDESFIPAYYERGHIHTTKKEYNQAIQDYNKVIELDESFSIAYYCRGNVYSEIEMYDLAINDYTTAIELDERYIDAYYKRAKTYKEIGMYKLAIKDYTQFIELDESFSVAYYRRGSIYEDIEMYDLAIKDYTKAIELDKSFETVYYRRGNAHFQTEEYDLAIEDYTKVIELDEGYVDAYYNRGNAHVVKEEYDLAIEDFTRVIELDEGYANAYLNRGNAHFQTEEYDLAIEDYTKVIELDEGFATAYYSRGNAHAVKKEYDLAIEDYTKVIELDEGFATAYYNRGNTHGFKKEYDLAIEDYTKVIELDEGYANAYLNRGNAHAVKEEYDLAIEDFTKIIELDEGFATAYLNRGNAHFQTGEYDLAIEDYTKIIELDEGYANAYFNRGNAHDFKKEYDLAIKDYTKIIELDEGFATAYFNRGNAHFQTGEYDLAIEDFTKVIELDEGFATAYERLHSIYSDKLITEEDPLMKKHYEEQLNKILKKIR